MKAYKCDNCGEYMDEPVVMLAIPAGTIRISFEPLKPKEIGDLCLKCLKAAFREAIE